MNRDEGSLSWCVPVRELPCLQHLYLISIMISNFTEIKAEHTGAPGDVVGLHLVQDALGLVLGRDILDAADENIELSGKTDTKLLNGWNLLRSTDDTGDGPGALKQEGSKVLSDVAVAAEDEDVVRSHFVVLTKFQDP